jgi:phosphoribosyl-AMP cyclohydrolase
MATITITGERLMAMYDNDMALFVTPGAEEQPYWASRPNFQDDYSVATAGAVVEFVSIEYGTDEDDLRTDETVYEVDLSDVEVEDY